MANTDGTPHNQEADQRRRHPLARGIELITLMVDSNQDAFGVRELAGRLDVSPSTIHRLLADLEKLGLVARLPNGSYRLGLEFLRLAWTTAERYPIQAAAEETLADLKDKSGESAFFAVFDERRLAMMFARVVESPHPLRYSLPLRQWIPLHTGASGLAMLAFLPRENQESIARGTIVAATDRTPVDGDALLQRLEGIRRDGYAMTHGERIQGAIAIAAPVIGPVGAVIGSVGITLPETRFNVADSGRLADLVRQSASRVTDYLNGAWGPQTGILRGVERG